MKETIIAKRYAIALLKVAKDGKIIEAVRKNISTFTRLLSEQLGLITFFCDDEVVHVKKLASLNDLAKALNLHGLIVKYLSLLIEKKRFRLIFEIEKQFIRLADHEENVLRGIITVADKTDSDKIQQRLTSLIKNKTNKNVELEINHDPTILGGVILKVGDKVWDVSVKNKLNLIKERLCQ